MYACVLVDVIQGMDLSAAASLELDGMAVVAVDGVLEEVPLLVLAEGDHVVSGTRARPDLCRRTQRHRHRENPAAMAA